MTVKLPPQALASEKVILASFLVIPSTLDEYMEDVHSHLFYAPSHKTVMEAIEALYSSSKVVDMITVLNQIKSSKTGVSEPVENLLSELVSDIATNENLSTHIETIRGKYELRKLIDIYTTGLEDAYAPDANSTSVLGDTERGLSEVYERSEKSKPVHISRIAIDMMEKLREGLKNPHITAGTPTGLRTLDNTTGGFRGGELVILAARPSCGKSSLALTMSLHCGEPCVVFSLEMPKEQLGAKYKSMISKVPLFKIRNQYITEAEFEMVQDAANRLMNKNIHIEDKPGLTIPELRSKLRRLKKQHGIKIAFIDYLQLMRGHKKTHSREQEISSISMSLKELAKEVDITIVALSQLSRALEHRPDKRPILSDLRESGAIEQDADIVMFLYRGELYDDTDPNLKGKAELIIGKQRNGPLATIHCKFNHNTTEFYEETGNEHLSDYSKGF